MHFHTTKNKLQFSSLQLSHSVVSDSLWPHESQHARPVHHQLPEFTQTHVHQVGDAIQQSHPLSSPSPPAPNPSQHQGLFQWVNSSHEVAKVLESQLNHMQIFISFFTALFIISIPRTHISNIQFDESEHMQTLRVYHHHSQGSSCIQHLPNFKKVNLDSRRSTNGSRW